MVNLCLKAAGCAPNQEDAQKPFARNHTMALACYTIFKRQARQSALTRHEAQEAKPAQHNSVMIATSLPQVHKKQLDACNTRNLVKLHVSGKVALPFRPPCSTIY